MEAYYTPIVLSLLLTGVAILKAPYESYLKKRRALKNIDAQPLVDVGRKFKGLYCLGRENPVFGPCEIMEINNTCILFQSLEDKSQVVFTGEEVQELVLISLPVKKTRKNK